MDSKSITAALIKDVSSTAAAAALCYFREGRLDLASIGDQEDQGSGKGSAILPLSLSPALWAARLLLFKGRLE